MPAIESAYFAAPCGKRVVTGGELLVTTRADLLSAGVSNRLATCRSQVTGSLAHPSQASDWRNASLPFVRLADAPHALAAFP